MYRYGFKLDPIDIVPSGLKLPHGGVDGLFQWISSGVEYSGLAQPSTMLSII